ncbi:patatin-like phospholipase family protein [Saccharicrinis aurantiacus]|uniref:patatin-like phospholipase family protein n=1 Tax=Saccharicrinis aurantiacus TaxID=1849719 RepID=UPI00094F65F2|nr:patatin family protein [Saccharicrinis aurantiacus]
MKQKTALILEGGGTRGMFTAGILESFLNKNINFDAVYGVSAGVTYGASFVSQQKNRNLNINQYIGDKRYSGLKHLLLSGSYLAWDFVLGELAHEIYPFDYEAFRKSTDLYVGISNCNSGNAEFVKTNHLSKHDIRKVIQASVSLPLLTPIVTYQGQPYLDGGLADAIPFEQALKDGAYKLVVIVTQPKGYLKKDIQFKKIFKWKYRKYPKVYEMLVSRASRYNQSLQRLNELEQQGKAFVIYPKEELNVSRIEKDPNKTEAIYHEAMQYSKELLPLLQDWM